ncbi:hypothetical protein [Burkholderia pseudomallei]|uniref:hypothetical protein n=1 Tax=Burkholderia pseudomallei TaxID=28450 RepID=UPI003CE7AD91
MPVITTENALNILTNWLQDNIDCDSGIVFDNDEDNTDSAVLLPHITQAFEDAGVLRLLRLLQRARED